jgi:hypothetical protein
MAVPYPNLHNLTPLTNFRLSDRLWIQLKAKHTGYVVCNLNLQEHPRAQLPHVDLTPDGFSMMNEQFLALINRRQTTETTTPKAPPSEFRIATLTRVNGRYEAVFFPVETLEAGNPLGIYYQCDDQDGITCRKATNMELDRAERIFGQAVLDTAQNPVVIDQDWDVPLPVRWFYHTEIMNEDMP